MEGRAYSLGCCWVSVDQCAPGCPLEVATLAEARSSPQTCPPATTRLSKPPFPSPRPSRPTCRAASSSSESRRLRNSIRAAAAASSALLSTCLHSRFSSSSISFRLVGQRGAGQGEGSQARQVEPRWRSGGPMRACASPAPVSLPFSALPRVYFVEYPPPPPKAPASASSVGVCLG
jgi:hypothetical protein